MGILKMKGNLVSNKLVTCLDEMVQGRETPHDGRTDGTQDQDKGQIQVAYQSPSEDTAVFVVGANVES
ncbi:unnamed protein product [Nezara viridula]|uniref:Uncharacterized protein n=1 Tax=Nezara viridula TaxID=85310 RepID=A0A9P0HMN6_NEZVI|nr:unnamed protein product [Nezara viridula]